MKLSVQLSWPQITRVNSFLAFSIDTKHQVFNMEDGPRLLCVYAYGVVAMVVVVCVRVCVRA